MRTHRRWWIAAVLAAVPCGTVVVGIALRASSDLERRPDLGPGPNPPAIAERDALDEPVQPELAPATSAVGARPGEKTPNEGPAGGGTAAKDLPIEEALASTEEPGAVFYASRIREALREGNPAFAEELLRQMREQHASSVLVDEAVLLVEESSSSAGRWQP